MDLPAIHPAPSEHVTQRRARQKKRFNSLLTANLENCKYSVVRECVVESGFKVVDEEVPWLLLWMDTGVSIERVLDM
jgi:hypothetical protein